MTTQEVIEFFGSKANVAKALGIKKPSVSGWGEVPPIGRQYQIQAITKGKLKASPKTAAA